MSKYPVFLDLAGRRVVLIGAGPVAVRKAKVLMETGARLVVVAEDVNEMMALHRSNSKAELLRSRYSKNYLAGAVLVIAATNDHKLNERIYKDCQKLEILCNVVDAPELCDFYVPAVVKRGSLQIAVGTDGNCPAYAGHIRKKLETIFTEEHGRFLAKLETLRSRIIRDVPDPNDRKAILGHLVDDESFEYFLQNSDEAWKARAEKIIKEYVKT